MMESMLVKYSFDEQVFIITALKAVEAMDSEIIQIHCISKFDWEVKLNHKMKKSELLMIT